MTQLQLEVGANTIPIPSEIKTVAGVAIIDLRHRRVPLTPLSNNDFDDIARGRQEFRGLPTYYNVVSTAGNRHIRIWPCAAHAWQVVLTIEDILAQEEHDARTDHSQAV